MTYPLIPSYSTVRFIGSSSKLTVCPFSLNTVPLFRSIRFPSLDIAYTRSCIASNESADSSVSLPSASNFFKSGVFKYLVNRWPTSRESSPGNIRNIAVRLQTVSVSCSIGSISLLIFTLRSNRRSSHLTKSKCWF